MGILCTSKQRVLAVNIPKRMAIGDVVYVIWDITIHKGYHYQPKVNREK
jgi:hypothetical protein